MRTALAITGEVRVAAKFTRMTRAESHTQCPFCAIVHGQAPATVLAETEHSIIIRPLGPVTEGHVLVIPRKHVDDFTERPDVTAAVMEDAADFAGRWGDVNLITSKGSAATQTVYHLHVHLVPRRQGDGLALPWT